MLVLSPTKDLATEISTILVDLGIPIGVRGGACVGGTKIADDQRMLAERPHVISGTPGRVADLVKRGSLRTNNIKVLVLHMGSKLLTPIFQADIRLVHLALPHGVDIIHTASTSIRGKVRN